MTEFSNAVFIMTEDTKRSLEERLEKEIRTRYEYALRVGAKKILTVYDYNYLRDCILGGHISRGLISDVERYAIYTDISAYEARLRRNPDLKFKIRSYSYEETQDENGEYDGYVLTYDDGYVLTYDDGYVLTYDDGYVLTYDDGHTSCSWSDVVRTLNY